MICQDPPAWPTMLEETIIRHSVSTINRVAPHPMIVSTRCPSLVRTPEYRLSTMLSVHLSFRLGADEAHTRRTAVRDMLTGWCGVARGQARPDRWTL